jgi:hypothetical protein
MGLELRQMVSDGGQSIGNGFTTRRCGLWRAYWHGVVGLPGAV